MDSPTPNRCPLQSDRHQNSRDILSTKITSLTVSLPKARGKIKLRGNNMKNLRSQPTSVSNHLSRPPEPPSAFLSTRLLSLFLVFSLFISLALGSLVADETSRTKNWGRATRTTRSQLRDRASSNYVQHKTSDSSDSFSHRPGHVHHPLNWQQREQNQQEQNQLRYLIARSASMPQLIGRDPHEASSSSSSSHSSEQQYRRLGHHETEHEDNKLVGHHHKRNHHPEPVQRAGNERSVPVALARSVHRLKSPFGTPTTTTTTNQIDLKRFQFGHSNRFGYDFDSLDVGLEDFDDDEDEEEQIEDSLDDVDEDDDDDSVVDTDNDAGGNGIDDGANSKEEDTTTEGTQTEATDESNSIPDSYGDSDDDDDDDDDDEEEDVDDDDDQNSIEPKRATTNGGREKKRKQADTLHRHPSAATRGAKNIHESSHVSKINSNVSRTDKLAIHISRQQLDEPLEQSRNWAREYDNEVQANSRRTITSSPPILDQLEIEESRERASYRPRAVPLESPPSAPYQSPVVVSINDNSFVSASPISVGMSSDEQAESSRRFEVSGAPHYSHIISSPKNELHNKRYWHESHIQMIQEEPNELHRGNINSAIIAILFGIGVTGTLIMIVSIKMRSIRERVAYKGRRRSLVPDTDFLINTIPM